MTEGDEKWIRRGHEWSWDDETPRSLGGFERVTRTAIRWSWVVALVVVGVKIAQGI